jgi:hypothetical protein
MLTTYTTPTNIIGTLGTDPEDRPDLDDQDLKNKFDQNAANIANYINGTHLPEVQTALDALESTKEDSLISFVDDTASRNIVTTDFRKKLRASHATTPIVYTVLNDTLLTASIGEWIIIEQTGAAQVSVAAGAGVIITLASKLKINGQGTSAALVKEKANEWSWQGSVKV